MKNTPKIHIEEKTASPINGVGQTWIVTCKRRRLGPCISVSMKVNLNWIKDLSVRLETLKQTEKKVGNMLQLKNTGMGFLKRIPVIQALKPTSNKWDLSENDLLYAVGLLLHHSSEEEAYRMGGKSLLVIHMRDA